MPKAMLPESTIVKMAYPRKASSDKAREEGLLVMRLLFSSMLKVSYEL
jgi:hypothetical protein